jgi:hypothetical protein
MFPLLWDFRAPSTVVVFDFLMSRAELGLGIGFTMILLRLRELQFLYTRYKQRSPVATA